MLFTYYSPSITAHVYLSLGSTNIINNTDILITDFGEGDILPSLTCHTDLINCCRNSDTGGQGGRGAWYYPDGSLVQRRSQAEGEDFYIRRNAPQLICLNRRESTNSLPPTGSYCCVIPTLGGERTICANIGKAITNCYKINFRFWKNDVVDVCSSLSPLTSGRIPSCFFHSFIFLITAAVHVHLSLGTRDITINNTEILITDIGEDAPGSLPNLICHTDLTECCRAIDTGGQGSLGAWYYPGGRVIQNNAAGEKFYTRKNAPQMIWLRRRESTNPLSPTGPYCCVIPTTGGEMTFCANIGKVVIDCLLL